MLVYELMRAGDLGRALACDQHEPRRCEFTLVCNYVLLQLNTAMQTERYGGHFVFCPPPAIVLPAW